VRWETEQPFDGKLCLEYFCQQLSKSDNWFSSYSQKCRGCFFLGHSVVVVECEEAAGRECELDWLSEMTEDEYNQLTPCTRHDVDYIHLQLNKERLKKY